MKCPFGPGECLGRECPGWSLGRCFIELLVRKMDNISLKLDTLCNLTSLTAMSRVPTVTEQPETVQREEAHSDNGPIKKEAEEAGNQHQPKFWNIPAIAFKNKKRATHPPEEKTPQESSDITHGLEMATEGFAREHTAAAAEQPLQQDIAPVIPDLKATGEGQDGVNGHKGARDDEPLPEFPAKVSEIVFKDETEAHLAAALAAAQSITPQELTLELTPVEELTPEPSEGLEVDERALLMSPPVNGSGTIDVTVDGLMQELEYDEVDQAVSQQEGDSLTEALTTPEEQRVLFKHEQPVEDEAAPPVHNEELATEKVIDDITSSDVAPDETCAGDEEKHCGALPVQDLMSQAGPHAVESVATQITEPTKRQDSETEQAVVRPPETAPDLAPTEQAETSSKTAGVPEQEEALEPKGEVMPSDEVRAEDAPSELAPRDSAAVDESEPAEALDFPEGELVTTDQEVALPEEPLPWEPIGQVAANGQTFLGIDFGAAFSKVALKIGETIPATPIPLALMAYEVLHKADLVRHFESPNEYAEESLIYFDQNEFVYCGTLAKKLSLEAAEAGQPRPAIQSLKTFLMRGGANLQIHSDFFPASESLDSQSVLAIYLAYLLRLTRHYLSKQTGKNAVDMDATIRNFSIPTWIEERYREDVKRLFRGAAAYAYCLERWLKDDLVRGARLPDVRKALHEAREHKSKIEEALVGSIMTESAAAGHARLAGLPYEKARPSMLLAINIGAGFTDFALLSVAYDEGRDSKAAAHVVYRGGVGTGVGVWDNALKTLLFNRVREVPSTRRKVNEFRLFKARLELQAREIKENIMTSDEGIPLDVSPVLPEPILVERSELESSLPVKAALFGIRDGLRVFVREAIKAVGMHRFDPAFTEIIVTGGGAFLPSVVDCIREAVATLGPAYPPKVKADYVSPIYTSLPNIEQFYPALVVSLGSAEKEIPEEEATGRAAAAQAPNTPVTRAVSSTQTRVSSPGPTHEVKIPTKRANRFRLS